MAQLEEEGTFELKPIDWEPREAQDQSSQSVGLQIRFAVLAKYDYAARDWTVFDPSSYEVSGVFYIINRDGNVNEFQTEALRQAFAWDGNIKRLFGPDPYLLPECSGTVKREEYKGKIYFRVKFVNRARQVRGGPAPTQNMLERIQAKLDGKPPPTPEPLPPTTEPEPLQANDEVPF